jgi:hypothetical protein
MNFQAGMQQPGILQPAEADSTSIGRRRFTEQQRAGNQDRRSDPIPPQPPPPPGMDRANRLLRSKAGAGARFRFLLTVTGIHE